MAAANTPRPPALPLSRRCLRARTRWRWCASNEGKSASNKYEATVEGHDYARSLDGIDASTLRAESAKGVKPQVNISEFQAETACEAASKRLCTESEWRTACQGPAHLIYPYGNPYVAGACNTGRPSPVNALFGTIGGRLDDRGLRKWRTGARWEGRFRSA